MTTHTNSIFTDKEHYLAFRAAWAKSANEKNNNITGAHHMVYNILRGQAFDKGFSPIVNTNKLQNNFLINQGLYDAAKSLRYPAYTKSVFGGTVTQEMLDKIHIPIVSAMDADYGPYRKVARHIFECDIQHKPKTFKDIQTIYENIHGEAA